MQPPLTDLLSIRTSNNPVCYTRVTGGGGKGVTTQLHTYFALLLLTIECCVGFTPPPLPSPPLVFSLLMTTMCLEYQPSAVACVCIHLACHWKEIEVRGGLEEDKVQ